MRDIMTTPEEADKLRGHKLYRSTGDVIVRWSIPVDLRRRLKIFQLQNELSADEAVIELLEKGLGEKEGGNEE